MVVMGTVSLPPPVAIAAGEFLIVVLKKMNAAYGKGNDVMESYTQGQI